MADTTTNESEAAAEATATGGTAATSLAPQRPPNPYNKKNDEITNIIHSLGRSKNTRSGDNPALSLFAYWRNNRTNRITEITEEEIKDDNLHDMMLLFCDYLGHTPIPKHWRLVDGEIRPPLSKEDADEVPCLGAATLVKYVGRVIAWFRRAFPNHLDFKDLDPTDSAAVPNWWSLYRPKLEEEIKDLLQRFDNDFTHGSADIRPLYYQNDYTHSSQGLVNMISLEWILEQLFKKAVVGHHIKDGTLQHRCWLSTIYNAVSRPGELKYVDTSNWMWHPRFDTTDFKWVETKTSSVQAMPMLPDKKHYLLCIYHCLGSFWTVEDGLFRDETDPSSSATYLFPLLRGFKDNSVAKRILNTIRNILPDNTPEELKKSYSGKSLRQAGITFLLLGHSLSYTDVTGRSGHDSNTTVDTYQDKTNIATGMRAAKLLAHWDPDADVKVPKLDSLPDSAVYDMMKYLFIISDPMKAFMKGGDLHYVLRTCMASLLMHHNAVEADYGPENAVASKVLKAAVDANIKDQRHPNLDPASLLRKWSQEVKDQFEAANPDIMSVTANGANVVAAINQQSAMIQQLCAQNQALLDIVARKDQRILSLEGAVLTMNGNYQTMSRQLVEVVNKLQSSRTPSSSRKRGREDDMSPQGQRPLPAPPLAQPQQAASTLSTTAVPASQMPPRQLELVSMTNEGQTLTEGPKGVGVTLAKLLTDFSIGRRLAQGAWNKLHVPGTEYKDPGLLKNALELCYFVCNENEHVILREGCTSAVNRESIMQLASSVQVRAFDMMWTLEGKDPQTERVSNAGKSSQNTKKPLYMAVGRRVREYKQAVALFDSSKNKNDPLCARPAGM